MTNGNGNLIPMNERTKEEQREIARQGGIASGEARKQKATLKKALDSLLDQKYKGDKTYRDMATLGLIVGAIKGKAENYKVIAQVLGELDEPTNVETPVVNINVVDNTELEKALYEDNN